jgi:hypothetical protein
MSTVVPQKNISLFGQENRTGRMSVHGSRTLKDERVKILIMEMIKKHNIGLIVTHGEPEGVCGMARALCKEHAIPLKLHFLNFKFLRGAFEHRSKAVLRDADLALFIHDGKSRGTSNEVKLAIKMGIPHEFYQLDPTPFKTSVGFPVEADEWARGIEMPEPLPLPPAVEEAL